SRFSLFTHPATTSTDILSLHDALPICRRYSVRLLERGKLSSPDTSVAQDAHYFLSAHADPRDARANPQDSLGHYLQRACCLRLLGRPIVSRCLGGPTFVGGWSGYLRGGLPRLRG